MKNIKKRLTNIVLILALFGYLIFIGRSDYLLEWLAFNNFCYVWVIIAVLWLIKQDTCAKWLTAGSILSIFPAQILENIKNSVYGDNPAAHSSYWGVAAWIALVAVSLLIGILLEVRKYRKAHPKAKKQEAEE